MNNTANPHQTTLFCPCQSGKKISQCCAPLLEGNALPKNAEALMRSRYTAYTQCNASYLLATWHPSTRPETLSLDENPQPKWLGLSIRRFCQLSENSAEIEFIARYRLKGRGYRLHENSRFICEKGRWYYVDGDIYSS